MPSKDWRFVAYKTDMIPLPYAMFASAQSHITDPLPNTASDEEGSPDDRIPDMPDTVLWPPWVGSMDRGEA
jgi:hypothetical protein